MTKIKKTGEEHKLHSNFKPDFMSAYSWIVTQRQKQERSLYRNIPDSKKSAK